MQMIVPRKEGRWQRHAYRGIGGLHRDRAGGRSAQGEEQTISGPKKRSIELISTERKSAKQNVACTVMSSDEVA